MRPKKPKERANIGEAVHFVLLSDKADSCLAAIVVGLPEREDERAAGRANLAVLPNEFARPWHPLYEPCIQHQPKTLLITGPELKRTRQMVHFSWHRLSECPNPSPEGNDGENS